jgi:hypothetical protein
MPAELVSAAGALVDLPATELRLQRVFQRRGRILDPTLPWVDQATTSIPLQYAWAHLAVAQAHGQRGNEPAAEAHTQQARWWQALPAQD